MQAIYKVRLLTLRLLPSNSVVDKTAYNSETAEDNDIAKYRDEKVYTLSTNYITHHRFPSFLEENKRRTIV